MQQEDLYVAETGKSPADFARDFDRVAGKYGFIINNPETMDMGKTFRAHGAEAGPDFDLHMIQICKPEKAAVSLQANPERAILMPKFVMTFTQNAKTQVRLLIYNRPMIEALVGEPAFADSLEESYNAIKNMIEEAL